MKVPPVAVLMAVFDGERYLRDAIDSILSQTHRDFDFLIVDDGSRDASRDIVISFRDPRIRLIENGTNIGLTRSLNRGLEMIESPFVARQDADDISHPERLEKQLTYLLRHPEVALVATQLRVVDERGRVVRVIRQRPVTRAAVDWHLMFDNPFAHTSVMFRTGIVRDQLGGYDESHRHRQDYELWSRLASLHECVNLSDVLVDFRSHSSSVTQDRSSAELDSKRDSLQKMIQVQTRNILRVLDSRELAANWPPIWAEVNSEWLVEAHPQPGAAVDLLKEMRLRFLALNEGAEDDENQRHYYAEVLARLAIYLATRDSSAALRCLILLSRVSRGMAVRAVPLVIVSNLIGSDRVIRLGRTVRRALAAARARVRTLSGSAGKRS